MPIYEPTENKPTTTSTSTAPQTPPLKVPDTAAVYDAVPKQGLDITLDGAPWIVTYYSQVLGKDDSPRRLDLGLSPTLQQYLKVNSFVVLVTESLSSTEDEMRITTVTGGGTLYPALAPNVGDHFVGETPEGRYGLFVVTEAKRNKYYSYTSWNITFQLVDFISAKYQQNLDLKTVETRWFDLDNPSNLGRSGVDRKAHYRIAERLSGLVSQYWDEFYLKEAFTLVYTKDNVPMYDCMVVDFLTDILPYELYKNQSPIRDQPIPIVNHKKKFSSLWDCLLMGSMDELSSVGTHAAVMSSRSFYSRYVYSAVSMAGIQRVIVPDYYVSVDNHRGLTETEPYVLSEAFYADTVKAMTPFEQLLRSMLNGDTVAPGDVIEHIENLKATSPVKRFYRTPVLIWMLLKLYKEL